MSILSLFRRRSQKKTDSHDADGRYEVILSGSGGQGVILAGKILAEAASIYDNKEAVMAQSYGPEARGGASRAEVIISTEAIDYPKVMSADILLVMTQQALDTYGKMLKKDGLLVADEILVKQIPSNFKHVFKAPFTQLAIKLLDMPLAVNIVALGALASISKIVSREALIHAALEHFPKKFVVPDRIAVDIGFKSVKDIGFKWDRRG